MKLNQQGKDDTSYNLSSPCGNIGKNHEFHCIGGCTDDDDNNGPTWSELQHIETERREILQRVELPFWRILGYWSGTCLRSLMADWMIWVSIVTFLAIRIEARSGEAMPALVEYLGDTDIDILGGFLSFLLVLFVNQTNTRFFDMYQLSKKCSGQVQDIAGLASTKLSPTEAHRLVRYMNAANVAGYVGLGGPYSKCHFFDHFNAEHYLLTPKELDQLQGSRKMDGGSSTMKELVTWCQHDIGRAQKSGRIDSYEAAQFHSHILAFRGAMDGIYDFCDQPTHFFYIHFLCLLSALYLPLFAIDNAYSAGWGEDADFSFECLNAIIVLVQAIFVVGLRLLGQKMTDPFGDDLEDLSVLTYVETTLENSRIILTARQPQNDVDDALEQQLQSKQQTPNKVVGEAA